MAKIDFSNIPLNIIDKIKNLDQLDEVINGLEFSEQYIKSNTLECSFEAMSDGYILIAFSQVDLWLLRLPDGIWKQAYIGYDKDFVESVLKRDNMVEVFSAHINVFEKVLPVFI
ncbi:hypothetical protein ACX1NX_11315 [Acinetobacter sp. ANC 5383]